MSGTKRAACLSQNPTG